MKASNQVKRAALNKTVNYLLEDPERNVTKIMDMLDKVAPDNLFPSQRKAFRTAIDEQNNWFQLIMKHASISNPAVRDDLIKAVRDRRQPDGMARAGRQMRDEVPVQHPLGPAAGPDKRLQPALHGLLGRRVRSAR